MVGVGPGQAYKVEEILPTNSQEQIVPTPQYNAPFWA